MNPCPPEFVPVASGLNTPYTMHTCDSGFRLLPCILVSIIQAARLVRRKENENSSVFCKFRQLPASERRHTYQQTDLRK